MTDRPGNGGPGEGPEFGWLYGRPPGSDEQSPEATRKIPVQPRPGQSGGQSGPPTENLGRRLPPPAAQQRTDPRPPVPAPTPYQPGQPYQQPYGQPPQQPPGRPGRAGGGFWARRLRRPGFYVRTVLVLLLLWVTYIVAVPFITWQSAEQVAFEPDGDRPAEQDGTTYLLVGSDSRRDLSAAERKKLSTGNPQSELTDTMMLLHTGDGPSVLLSIPRDTRIDRPFFSGKINGAYGRGGAALLTRVIETETGIRVDKYVEIGLGGVADVVDAVGGIEVCPVERIKDPLAGLNIRRGCQEINGTKALAYSRSRKQSALGDLERVRRQREVIGAIGDKVLSPWSVVNPVRWWKLNKAVPSFFAFGEGMSSLDASRWALAMSKSGGTDNLTCTMPVTDGSAETWDRDRADPLFAAIIDDDTDKITKKQCTPNGIVR
ncbi:LCP family protein [Nocardioides sp.]|uniref:LCP family protein n=1 Tax=Nocardioides sp. TaxID=35761 RepID=UPI0027226600|nr:LCP family protein [Nocardioides sp.]MDO9456955.1 LCP family protein [Nocardioides sp.]